MAERIKLDISKHHGEYFAEFDDLTEGSESLIFRIYKNKETLVFLSGTIYNRGCTDLYFGDKGYIHVCNQHNFDAISKVLSQIKRIGRNGLSSFRARYFHYYIY